jgi:RNA polymerase sigma-54 factor
LNISLETSLRLSQTLSPQMIQSLKLLQYNNLQLEQVIRKELQENPILEESAQDEDEDEDTKVPEATAEQNAEEPEPLIPPPAGSAPAPAPAREEPEEAAAKENRVEEVDWDDYFAGDGTDLSRSRNEDNETGEIYDKVQVAMPSMEEHLLRQLNEKNFTAAQVEIGEMIIGSINDKGYLTMEAAALAEKLSVSVKEVEEVRHLIMRFDPPGIASMDLRENLLTQIYAKGLAHTLMGRIVEGHFELLKKYQIPEIAKRLNVPMPDVQVAIREIGRLEPNPGTLVGGARTQIIIPDLIVTKLENGEFAVTLNDGNVPNIKISRSYVRLLKGEKRKSADVKKYVSEKLNAANWLIRSIEQRKITMIKVMNAIVEKQREWFEKGPPNLKPLILQEVATHIGMHVSTVCRVTNDKYAQTPFGIFELKYFFGSGVEQEDGSEVATSQAKEILRELIVAEDRKKPLSDQRLVEILKEKGIVVARRTISKYREQLGLLPARLRKEF